MQESRSEISAPQHGGPSAGGSKLLYGTNAPAEAEDQLLAGVKPVGALCLWNLLFPQLREIYQGIQKLWK